MIGGFASLGVPFFQFTTDLYPGEFITEKFNRLDIVDITWRQSFPQLHSRPYSGLPIGFQRPVFKEDLVDCEFTAFGGKRRQIERPGNIVKQAMSPFKGIARTNHPFCGQSRRKHAVARCKRCCDTLPRRQLARPGDPQRDGGCCAHPYCIGGLLKGKPQQITDPRRSRHRDYKPLIPAKFSQIGTITEPRINLIRHHHRDQKLFAAERCRTGQGEMRAEPIARMTARKPVIEIIFSNHAAIDETGHFQRHRGIDKQRPSGIEPSSLTASETPANVRSLTIMRRKGTG